MEFVLYGAAAILLGVSIFLFVRRKANARETMLMAIEIAEEAAKLTKTKIDDQLIALIKNAIIGSTETTKDSVLDHIKINKPED